MAEQQPLFDKPPKPRQKPRVMMHVIDAGENVDGSSDIAVFRCNKCGAETDWTPYRTVSEAKRGIPCEACNGESK